jgi:hypothetical protein
VANVGSKTHSELEVAEVSIRRGEILRVVGLDMVDSFKRSVIPLVKPGDSLQQHSYIVHALGHPEEATEKTMRSAAALKSEQNG